MASRGAAGGPRGLAEVLERWLQSPLGASQCCRSSGAVPIIDAIGMCAELRELSGGSIARLASALGAEPPEGPVAVDAAGQAVRLRSVSERVRAAAERQVMAAPGGGASLLDLLEAGAVAALLGGVPEVSERLEVLRQALGASERVEVCGSRAAARGPAPPADSTPPRVPSRSLQLDVLGGVRRDDGQAADALSDALSDAEPQEPGADGDAPTPESAFRTPSLGSEPGACGSSPCAPGGAQGCGESPATGRECAAGAAHLGAAAAAAAAGASQSEHAPQWSGPEDQQFMPLCGGAGGQWLWCPLVLPAEAFGRKPWGLTVPS
ncbi:unnamed protein product [Prorocentrum cordatum]|uniref:Uncharacterized protein n=1 Tax=Prorocentrum cordatum TaxID=2364126 RepID=A0ABN9WJ53_9DINO|nr:unnamed protein product [Polarella glacialis]